MREYEQVADPTFSHPTCACRPTLLACPQTHTNFTQLAPSFYSIADDLLQQTPEGRVKNLQLSPGGVLRMVFPPNDSDSSQLGIDQINTPTTRQDALDTIVNGQPVMSWLLDTTANLSMLVVRVPIFVSSVSADETFGGYSVVNCDVCYNASTRTKFWGFSAVALNFADLADGTAGELSTLAALGYSYKLLRSANTTSVTPDVVIGQSPSASAGLDEYVLATVSVPGGSWFLYIMPSTGWSYSWVTPIIVAIIILSLLSAALLAAVMLSYRQHQILLHNLVPLTVLERVRKSGNMFAKLDGEDGSLHVTGTPGDKMLDIIGLCLKNQAPDLQDLILVRTAILQNFDLRAPIGMGQQIIDAGDVGEALARLVGAQATASCPNASGSFQLRAREPGAGWSLDVKPQAPLMAEVFPMAPPDQPGFGSMQEALLALLDTEDVLVELEAQASSGQTASRTSAASAMSQLFANGHAPGEAKTRQDPELLKERPTAALPLSSEVLPSLPSLSTRSWTGSDPSARGKGSSTRLRSVRRGVSLACNLGVSAASTPALPLLSDVERCLAAANDWNYDIFKLDELTEGRPLSTLAYFLFSQSQVLSSIHLPGIKLARLLRKIEDGYIDSNPYHNKVHAAGVLQTLHVVVHQAGMVAAQGGYVDALELMAIYFAAIVHDYEHKGYTNDFLIATTDELALLYNDKSPQENHHLAAAFKLLQRPELDIFAGVVDKGERERFRKMVIDLVLATDMKQHFAIVSQFSALHRLAPIVAAASQRPSNESVQGPVSHSQVPGRQPSPKPPAGSTTSTSAEGGVSRRSGIAKRGSSSRLLHSCSPVPAREPLDELERLCSLQMAFKLSDLGHLASTLHVHTRWVAALEEEFFRQGDAEKACKLPVSPLFDRTKPGVTKSQVGFFDLIVIPCFHSFTTIFHGCKPLYKAVSVNHKHWVKEAKRGEKSGTLAVGIVEGEERDDDGV
ncbi:MAG: hypothetical protein WDW36_004570 [Sanguina aurantia]